MRHEFSFAGVSCREFGIWASGKGTANTPVRDVERIEVPGRSGDLIVDNGRYKNVDQTYACFAYGSFLDRFARFRNFVLTRTGYQRLEDSYAPDEYRMAVILDKFDPDIEDRLRNGTFEITFNCKPQRYLKLGEQRHRFTANGTLINPEFCDARPIVEVTGNGTLKIGTSIIVVANNPGTITIDSELMDVYSGATNCNNRVSMTGDRFPILGPGVSNVELGSEISSVTVIPRWWRL